MYAANLIPLNFFDVFYLEKFKPQKFSNWKFLLKFNHLDSCLDWDQAH